MATSWGDQEDNRRRWGDDDELDLPYDEDVAKSDELPGTYESQPDANGIKVVVEYKLNDKKEKVKVTKRVRVRYTQKKVKKAVLYRRSLPKFGACKDMPPGPETGFTFKPEDIELDLTAKPPKKKTSDQDDSDMISMLKQWSIARSQRMARGDEAPGEGPSTDAPSAHAEPEPAPTDGKYRLPVHRGRDMESISMDRDDYAKIRVTNVSEEAQEDDLRELFGAFGRIQRVFLAKDFHTGRAKGFAFINYYRREDAAMAIEKLNGFGYDNLILSVEWAKPREF